MPSLTIRQRKSRLHRQMLQKPNMGLTSWKGRDGVRKETGIVDVVKTGAADVLRVTGTLSLNVQES